MLDDLDNLRMGDSCDPVIPGDVCSASLKLSRPRVGVGVACCFGCWDGMRQSEMIDGWFEMSCKTAETSPGVAKASVDGRSTAPFSLVVLSSSCCCCSKIGRQLVVGDPNSGPLTRTRCLRRVLRPVIMTRGGGGGKKGDRICVALEDGVDACGVEDVAGSGAGVGRVAAEIGTESEIESIEMSWGRGNQALIRTISSYRS